MKNKVVVITGSSSGIGEACARLFASMGSKVVLAARNEQALKDYRKKSASEAGVSSTTNGLLHEIHKKYPSFEPDGLRDYIRAQTSPNNKIARDRHYDLNL